MTHLVLGSTLKCVFTLDVTYDNVIRYLSYILFGVFEGSDVVYGKPYDEILFIVNKMFTDELNTVIKLPMLNIIQHAADNNNTDKLFIERSSVVEPGGLVKSVLGVAGYKGSGKDTLAMYVMEQNTEMFTLLHLATPLKLVIKILFGLTNDQLYDPILKDQDDAKWGYSPRKLMQVIGTELWRDRLKFYIDPSFFFFSQDTSIWSECLNRAIKKSKFSKIIVPDIRWADEANSIRNSFESKFILVQRNQNPLVSDTNLHRSELEHSSIKYDEIIENNGDLDGYYKRVRSSVTIIDFMARDIN